MGPRRSRSTRPSSPAPDDHVDVRPARVEQHGQRADDHRPGGGRDGQRRRQQPGVPGQRGCPGVDLGVDHHGGRGHGGPGWHLLNFGDLTLAECTVKGNTASTNGGGLANYGTATLTNCTVSGNQTATIGNHYGGAIFTKGGALYLTNCTIASNIASFAGGGIDAEGPVTVTSSTFFMNLAGVFGGAIDKNGNFSVPFVKVQDSILAGDSAPDGPEFWGTKVESLGNNLVSKTGREIGWIDSDLTGTIKDPLNPLLAPLDNYGGPTQTVALLPGSPAIGKGIAVRGVKTDQRGVARPSGSIDIGAFQDRGFTITAVAGSSPQSTLINTAFANPLAVIVSSPYGNPVAGGVITFSAP